MIVKMVKKFAKKDLVLFIPHIIKSLRDGGNEKPQAKHRQHPAAPPF
jgi:Mn-dependent DtxR family transcriptional regulator